jgi:hypothetical protein
MKSFNPKIGFALSLGILGGCGTTRQFVDQPHLTISEPQKDARQAIGELFGSLVPPYTVRLCEAERSSKECKQDSEGVSAKGVGGLFLPLVLNVRGMEVRSQRPTDDGLSFDASVNAKVDAIAPRCVTAGGQIVARENNTAFLKFRPFYCNWVVIGNVLVAADFSIDSISVKDRIVTGYYKLTFHGTGNAAGSGYYKAVITPKST